MNKKIQLYLDADDTILNSVETIVKILNNKYHLNKAAEDVADWGFKSIKKDITREEVIGIFESEEFFNNLTFKEDFLSFYEKYKDRYSFNIVTKGTDTNLSKKEKFIRSRIGIENFYGLNLGKGNYNKGSIAMTDGIQIDDRTDCLLSTNAKMKILITNGHKRIWNTYEGGEDNFYIVNNWKEIEEMLNFFYEHPEFNIKEI